MATKDPEKLTDALWAREAVKFADSTENFWTLKSGRKSPVYVNLRGLTSFDSKSDFETQERSRNARETVIAAYAGLLETLDLEDEYDYEHILGVPHAMTCMAGLVAQLRGDSVLSMRSDFKTYGAHKAIEGDFSVGDTVVALDDVITDGATKLETVEVIRANQLEIEKLLVLVDREEGGKEVIETGGLELISAMGLGGLTRILREQGRITNREVIWMEDYYFDLVNENIIADIPKSLQS